MPSTSSDKLPVLKTVGESLVLPLRSTSIIFSYAWPLLMVLIAADVLVAWATFPAELRMRANSADVPSFYFALALLSLLSNTSIGAALAVPWHRYLIEDRMPAYSGLVHERSRIVRYVLWGMATVLVYMVAAIPASLLSSPWLFATGELSTAQPSSFSLFALFAIFSLCLAPFYRYCLIFSVGSGRRWGEPACYCVCN